MRQVDLGAFEKCATLGLLRARRHRRRLQRLWMMNHAITLESFSGAGHGSRMKMVHSGRGKAENQNSLC